MKIKSSKLWSIYTDYYGVPSYIACERCKRSDKPPYSLHHICFKSEIPRHPDLHDPLNLLLVCHSCHRHFHDKKSNRDYIVEARELYNLFDHLPRPDAPIPHPTRD